MQQIGFPELILFSTVAVLLCWGNKIPGVALKLNEAIANFRGNFRGGPGSPSHPIPADDSKLLNRKIRRSDDKSDDSASR
jgi:Sec-independent protein translocase protein TatA